MYYEECCMLTEKVILVYYIMYRNLTADHLQKTSIVSYIKYVRDTGKTFVIRNSNKNIRLWLVLLAMQHGFALLYTVLSKKEETPHFFVAI